ncbi:hypothetical protein BDD12DRAFT_924071 [Trichophaea hybrida]|nr:hypothetical protein BDD12DRAFT_924071 [Trichophaea hybrida]
MPVLLGFVLLCLGFICGLEGIIRSKAFREEGFNSGNDLLVKHQVNRLANVNFSHAICMICRDDPTAVRTTPPESVYATKVRRLPQTTAISAPTTATSSNGQATTIQRKPKTLVPNRGVYATGVQHYFLGPYLTLLAVILAIVWRVIDTDIKRIEPFTPSLILMVPLPAF